MPHPRLLTQPHPEPNGVHHRRRPCVARSASTRLAFVDVHEAQQADQTEVR